MNNNSPLLAKLKSELLQKKSITPEHAAYFFKTQEGEYAHHDQFLGIRVPDIRKLAKQYTHISDEIVLELMYSPFNEERLLSLIILCEQYKKGSTETKEAIFQLYLSHITQVNNWNLVDASAHHIIGAHLYDKDRSLLKELAQSPNLWKRRIAIVATWFFIRKNDLTWTFMLAELLRNDTHDLMHKAVGWMLREAGKRDESKLTQFLDKHATHVPRTLLRYALEKLPPDTRRFYLRKKTSAIMLDIAHSSCYSS